MAQTFTSIPAGKSLFRSRSILKPSECCPDLVVTKVEPTKQVRFNQPSRSRVGSLQLVAECSPEFRDVISQLRRRQSRPYEAPLSDRTPLQPRQAIGTVTRSATSVAINLRKSEDRGRKPGEWSRQGVTDASAVKCPPQPAARTKQNAVTVVNIAYRFDGRGDETARKRVVSKRRTERRQV